MAEEIETTTTIGTVLQITKSRITAMCVKKRLFYTLEWRGTEPALRDLHIGSVVRIYHSNDYYPEVYAMEEE